jgi:hypothetical protein
LELLSHGGGMLEGKLVFFKKGLVIFESGEKKVVFYGPGMLYYSHTVELYIAERGGRGTVGKVSTISFTVSMLGAEIIGEDFRSNNEAKLAVETVVKGVIDYLNVSLILNVFEFIGWQAHYGGSFLPIKVDKGGLRNIS